MVGGLLLSQFAGVRCRANCDVNYIPGIAVMLAGVAIIALGVAWLIWTRE